MAGRDIFLRANGSYAAGREAGGAGADEFGETADEFAFWLCGSDA